MKCYSHNSQSLATAIQYVKSFIDDTAGNRQQSLDASISPTRSGEQFVKSSCSISQAGTGLPGLVYAEALMHLLLAIASLHMMYFQLSMAMAHIDVAETSRQLACNMLQANELTETFPA